MPQWKNTNDAANSVNYGAVLVKSGNSKSTIASNNTALFDNVTPGAFLSGNPAVAVGQFGVEANQMNSSANGESYAVTHAGWNLRTQGTGPIVSIVINA